MSSHMPAICQELDRLGVTNIDLYLSHLHVDHVGGSRQDWLYGLKYLYDYGIQIDTLYLPARLLHRNPPAMHRSMKLCVILWISIWAEGTPWYICRRGLVFESGMLWQM